MSALIHDQGFVHTAPPHSVTVATEDQNIRFTTVRKKPIDTELLVDLRPLRSGLAQRQRPSQLGSPGSTDINPR